ncbi:MAG: CHAT domain-containing protein, partial [Anaerolineae bacterium]|nr:CHAT domain-containing protein [Anaerolineae bacterium]
DERTILLEYYIDAQRAVVFVATESGLQVVPLDVCAAEIETLLRNWRLNVETSSWAVAQRRPLGSLAATARRLLQALHDKLLRPLAGYLATYERVVIVPYGVTHTVPFHALHDGARYLIEGWDVSYCPSSRLLQLCAQAAARPPNSALVLAYSQHGQLPYVLEEARAVVELLGGESYIEAEATRATLLARQGQHGVLHLAAHGEPRLDNPTFAHVALADGPLNLSDVLNLELGGALVTLSACDTGRGVVTGGDELVGLSRGFLHAGAVTLVQSLWQVQDAAAADLMRRFYQALREGQAKSEALREAQLTLLDNHGAHPYFWAPFQLIGAGDGPPALHPATLPDTQEVDP